jgi:hypothetical protein
MFANGMTALRGGFISIEELKFAASGTSGTSTSALELGGSIGLA